MMPKISSQTALWVEAQDAEQSKEIYRQLTKTYLDFIKLQPVCAIDGWLAAFNFFVGATGHIEDAISDEKHDEFRIGSLHTLALALFDEDVYDIAIDVRKKDDASKTIQDSRC